MHLPERKKKHTGGEKRMSCLNRLSRKDENQLWRWHFSEMPSQVVDYHLYLVMDGHTAGCVFLEDLSHPVGEPLILQLGLLLAVLLLVETEDGLSSEGFLKSGHYNRVTSKSWEKLWLKHVCVDFKPELTNIIKMTLEKSCLYCCITYSNYLKMRKVDFVKSFVFFTSLY